MTNAPESNDFSAPELHTFAIAREAVAHLNKTFEQWIIIARAVEIANEKAKQIKRRSAFQRILNQQGLAHALGNNWGSQKTTANKLLRILKNLPEIEAWRASLSREQRFAWQAPTTIYAPYPEFASDKAKRKPKPKADADTLSEVTADLRNAADRIVGKVSPGGEMFDLSPEMIEDAAKNFITIYGNEASWRFANTLHGMLSKERMAVNA